MMSPVTERSSSTIYMVGSPASGKTTLVNALADYLRIAEPGLKLRIVREVARDLVTRERVNPRDIQAGKDHAMKLQRIILETQAMREQEAMEDADLIVSDRSGIDPIVFTAQYGGPALAQALIDSRPWAFLRKRMQSSLVVLCEPQPQWYTEDGVRVVPVSATEMQNLHQTYAEILQAQAISFKTLSASENNIESRVMAVMYLWSGHVSTERIPPCVDGTGGNPRDE